MASKGRVEAKLEKLRELRGADATARIAALRRTLRDSSNYVVAKAAELAEASGDAELIPDLLAVYDSLFEDGAARDPQVWAKTAIARALRTLGHRDAAPFVRGLHHVQLEPVWGKHEDAAPNLRCVCAQSLVDTDLRAADALRELIPHLVDPFTVVRVEAVSAVAQIGGDEAALLLRLKAYAGDDEPEVIGACFAGVLEREPHDALAFIAPFLDHERDDVRAEAAAAIALSRDPAALDLLRDVLRRARSRALREATAAACAASPQRAVVELLLPIVAADDAALAQTALRALAASRFRAAVRERAHEAADRARDPRVAAAYAEAFEDGRA